METIFALTTMVLASSVSLGVGSSSLAITSFFAAIADGNIDESERRMLGVIYWMLRVAMVLITVSAVILTWVFPGTLAGVEFVWILIAVLYINAILMTKHWMPVKYGPALQAATWYTLGFLFSIEMFALMELTWLSFIGLYVIDFAVAFALVNGFMAYRKWRNKS